ncbi:hypothetical protein OSTOST_22251 [Ostertagia ostertagi]
MLFVLALPLLFLAGFNAEAEPTTKIPDLVKQIGTDVFVEINKHWNEFMEWDEGLSGFALVESVKPDTMATPQEIGWKKIRANRTFNGDYRNVTVKVKETLEEAFKKEGPEVKKLRRGTTYGCNGVFYEWATTAQ